HLAWLLLAVMLVRGLMPVGFMPDLGKAGALAIRICSSAGLQTIFIKTTDTDQSTPAPHHDSCALCAAPILSGALAQPPVAVVAFFILMATTIAGWTLLQRPRFYNVAAPRAPPAYS
ncbi:MAG: DUF2946 family protein, partial [Hyphomicrobium sp.]